MYTQAELLAFDDKVYRDAYVGDMVRSSVAHQIRSIRESFGLTQSEMAMRVGTTQSAISRIESADYGKMTVQTLVDVANGLDIGISIKFRSFSDFLADYDNLSDVTLPVESYMSFTEKLPSPPAASERVGLMGGLTMSLSNTSVVLPNGQSNSCTIATTNPGWGMPQSAENMTQSRHFFDVPTVIGFNNEAASPRRKVLA